VGGFSLHAGVAVRANQRNKRERVCRYISRPALSEQRLSLTAGGKVRYQLKTPYTNGTTHVVFEPLDFLAKLAALGYYDSRDDTNGTNTLVRNSELRLVLGYEQELATELTGGLQWYVESMQEYGAYQANLPEGANQRDRNRHVITIRLTKLLMNQNLTLSLFNFYSPTDEDGYLRLKGNYKLTDAWQLRAGVNLFYGQESFTFFGQFEQASNLYGAVRYGF
jgi:hypothetical protein